VLGWVECGCASVVCGAVCFVFLIGAIQNTDFLLLLLCCCVVVSSNTANWMRHRSPELWGDDVLEFNPMREFRGNELWDGASFAGYNPQSERYSPFTFTPRDCMGKNFAQMEMRVILAYLFHHFDFSLAGTTADFDRKTFLGVNRATLGPQDLGVDSQSPAELGLYMKIKARR
tara:strand:+ start:215 stop:733 length:519 start_codon:yes stop_codon:yes gene_type:complete